MSFIPSSPLPIVYTDAGDEEPQGLWGKIQRAAMVPIKQGMWTFVQYINQLQDSFAREVIPLVDSLNEEYFVVPFVVAVPQVAGPVSIPIPSNSVGLQLRDVWTYSKQNNGGNSSVQCVRVNPNQIPLFSGNLVAQNWAGYGGPLYYVQNNQIVFPYPIFPQFTNILLRFKQKPSNLISRYRCALVVAVDTVLNTITLDSSNMTGIPEGSPGPNPFHQGQVFDFLVGQVPFPFRSNGTTTAYQVQPSVVFVQPTGTTLSVDPSIATIVQIGDICCPTGLAPVTQYVSEEVWLYLVDCVVCKLFSSLSDAPGKQDALADKQASKETLIRVLTPKIQSEVKTLVSQRDLSSTISGALWTGFSSGGL